MEAFLAGTYYYAKAGDEKRVTEFVEKIRAYALRHPSERENIAHSLVDEIIKTESSPKVVRGLCLASSLALELLPDHEDIREINNALRESALLGRLFEDDGIPPYLCDLTTLAYKNCNCPVCACLKALSELEFYNDTAYNRKRILYFNEKYPELYELNKVFFSKVLDVKNEEKNYESAYKNMLRIKKQYPEEFAELTGGEEPEQGTVVNADLKVGRNDPCPCGSGKKYKKCCSKYRDIRNICIVCILCIKCIMRYICIIRI